jgi:hypothetical protein
MVSRFLDWRGAPACDLDVSFDDWSKLQKKIGRLVWYSTEMNVGRSYL